MRAFLAALLFAASTAVFADEPPQLAEVRESFFAAVALRGHDPKLCSVRIAVEDPTGETAGLVEFTCADAQAVCYAELHPTAPLTTEPECIASTPTKDL